MAEESNTEQAEKSQGGAADHVPRLDMLRGIAVLAVLWFHWMRPSGWDMLPWNGLWTDFSHLTPGYWFFYPISQGWVAVPVFYVLSGFVIHLSTLKLVSSGKKFDSREFLWRRFWRIYPVYALAVLIFSRKIHSSTFDTVVHLLLIHNFFQGTLFSIASAFWSLASEMQFYLFYPLIVPIVLRKGVLPVLRISIIVALCAILIIVLFLEKGVEDAHRFHWYFPVITWSDWILGAYMAERYYTKKPAFQVHAGWVILCVGLAIFMSHFLPLYLLVFHMVAFLAAIWVDRLARNNTALHLWERTLIGIGIISYSIYVWHYPLLYFIDKRLETRVLAKIPPTVVSPEWFPALQMGLGILPITAMMCLIGIVSYRLLERNATKLGSVIWKAITRRKPVKP